VVVIRGPVVLLRLERRGGPALGAFAAPLLLAGVPLGQARVRGLAFLQHLERIGELRGELQADAVGVEEIDALEDVVVGHAQHLDAAGLQPGLGVFQLLLGVHAEADVVDPFRRVGAGQRGLVVAKVEEGDEGAVLQAEEEVRVRAVLAGAGHVVALDDVVQRQAQDVLVEAACFLRVFRAVGVVVQLLDGCGCGQGGGGRHVGLLMVGGCGRRGVWRSPLCNAFLLS
jgi:hypothetical protein